MNYINNEKVEGLKIAYIGGGSRGWAWELMADLALDDQLSGLVNLYDIDFDAAMANEIIGNKLKGRADVVGKWDYKACKTLQEALTGADFIVISILPGTFDDMASDVHTPEKYGIYQAVGDTIGPGGIVRAMRTVPMYVEIAEAIKAFAPKAWVINYTNPMTVCVRTLYKVFPEVKAFGCCHEVFGDQNLMREMLEDMEGIKVAHRSEIRTNVLGINHFTWFDKMSYKGIDLFPMFEKFVDKYYETGYEQKETEADDLGDYFRSGRRVGFDLFRRYGIFAASGDRHVSEFMPPWYLKDPETVAAWGFALTPVAWRKHWREVLVDKSNKLVSGEAEFELKSSGEEGVLQMKAVLGLGYMVTNLNIPNKGQIPNLPFDCVVETNAVIERDLVSPVYAGCLPNNVDALVLKHVMTQEMIVEAGMTKNLNLAFNAFTNDNLVAIDIKDAEKLFAEMTNNTKAYLEGWGI
jgi:alpha-galactosidase